MSNDLPVSEAAEKAALDALMTNGGSVKGALAAALPHLLAGLWRPIETAPKDRTVILAVFRTDLLSIREDLGRWNGVRTTLRHPGLAPDGFDSGWSLAAPVGFGGFPDEWIAGWMPILPPPADSAREGGESAA